MFFRLFVILLLALSLFGCSSAPPKGNILHSMAGLDERYIPTLVFAELGRQRETEIALERLRRSWNEFHLKYYNLKIKYGVNIVDKFWQQDFDRINALITSAEAEAQANQLDQTFGSLEKVRGLFFNLRRRNGLKYFLDDMNLFDQVLTKIQAELRGKDRLTDKDLKNLQKLFEEAQEYWSKLADFKMTGRVFGFDEAKQAAIAKRIAEEQEALDQFKSALDLAETNDIFQAAQNLRPTFIVLYKAFGDFQPVFDTIIKERKQKGE